MSGRRRKNRPLQGVFDAMKQQDFASIEEANAWLQDAMASYNLEAQADLGGLSPRQMAQLLADDWSGRGVVRVARDLTWSEVRGSAWLQGARALLESTREQGPIRLTGDLDVDDAAILVRAHAMLGAAEGLGLLGGGFMTGELDPEDVFFSEVLELLIYAGLFRTKGDTLAATKRGMALVSEARAGELYATLVRAFVAEMSLMELHEIPGQLGAIEAFKGFTVYRLLHDARRWRGAAWLADRVAHPDLWSSPELAGLPRDLRAGLMVLLVLGPMVQLGLLEMSGRKGRPEPSFRCAPLFSRAVSFDWTRAVGVDPDPRRN